MVSLALALVVLLFLAPVAGVLLARLTGRLTWRRSVVAAVVGQLLLSVWMIGPGLGGMPRRVYSAGDTYTSRDSLIAQAPIVLVFTGTAALIAAGLTRLWHHFARRPSSDDSPPA